MFSDGRSEDKELVDLGNKKNLKKKRRNERIPLLKTKQIPIIYTHERKHFYAWLIPSIVTALPTGFLNFLGQLGIDIGTTNTWDELAKKVNKKTGGQITLAVLSGTGSTIVNTAVAVVFLPPALYVTGKTLKDFGIVITNACAKQCGKDKPFNDDHITARQLTINGVSVLYTIPTAATYAGIGFEEFGFIKWLATTAAFLNGAVYYASRLSGTIGALNLLFNPDIRFQSKLLFHLKSVNPINNFSIRINRGNYQQNKKRELTQALASYCKLVETDYEKSGGENFQLSGSKKAKAIIEYAVGSVLAIGASVFVWPVAAYETLRGFAVLSNPWFAKDNYQGNGQLFFGWINSAPTPFFYVKAALNMPGELFRSLWKLGQALKNCSNKSKFAIFGAVFFSLATALSIVSGQGMSDVEKSAIDKGHLDYLGKALIANLYIVCAWVGASIINYLSCLKIINRYFFDKLPDELSDINYDTAIQILTDHSGEIDAKLLREIVEGSKSPTKDLKRVVVNKSDTEDLKGTKNNGCLDSIKSYTAGFFKTCNTREGVDIIESSGEEEDNTITNDGIKPKRTCPSCIII